MGWLSSKLEDKKRIEELEKLLSIEQEKYYNVSETCGDLAYSKNTAEERVKRIANLNSVEGIKQISSQVATQIEDAFVRSHRSAKMRHSYITQIISRLLTEQAKGMPDWNEYVDNR